MRFAAAFLVFLGLLLCGAGVVRAQPSSGAISGFLAPDSPLVTAYDLDHITLRALYQTRANTPVWNTESAKGRKGIRVFLDSLEAYALYHGLNTARLPFETVKKILHSPAEDMNYTALELSMTDLVAKLARRIRGDDLPLRDIYRDWPFDAGRGAFLSDLATAINTRALESYLTELPPAHTKYKRLALVLQTYRAIEASGGWESVPEGPTIKPGGTDKRLGALRARLRAEGYDVPEEDGDLYTQALQDVVVMYQIRNGLEPDGEIGLKTISAMNLSAARRIRQIAVTMERMRHMPSFFPERHVFVNAANGWVQFFDGKDIAYEGPVVVGRNDRRTPFIQSEIRSIIFNPAWHVPARIAREDILPKLRKDPHYLEKMGYVIKGLGEGIDVSEIDWDLIESSDFNFRLRQAPGEMNALGKIKFDFDNDHAVYLHGTPKMELFKRAERHLSSGCIRVRDPEDFAVLVLAGNVTDWTREGVVREIAKGKTRWLKVLEPVPIFIAYETVHFPATDSPVSFHRDLYGYDRRLIKTLWDETE